MKGALLLTLVHVHRKSLGEPNPNRGDQEFIVLHPTANPGRGLSAVARWRVMRRRTPILLAALLLLAGCYSERFYEGDGKLEDNGFLVIMGERYVLELGKIDLARDGRYEYTLKNLPPEYLFTVGLEFKENIRTVEEFRTEVSVNLVRNGESVVSADGAIQDWILSHELGGEGVYAYQGGHHDGKGLECIAGTYFIASGWKEYKLFVVVKSEPDDEIKTAELKLVDAGGSVDCG